MKKSIIGYVEPEKVVEVVAVVEEEKIEKFLESIQSHDFENGYSSNKISSSDLSCSCELYEIPIKPLCTSSMLKTSEDIRFILKTLTEQKVINFQPLAELLESDSKMNNPLTAKIFIEFLSLYDFEKKSTYAVEKFSSIKKAISILGSYKDVDDFNSLAISLVNNTRFLRRLGRNTLLKPNLDMTIDKMLLR